MPNFVKFVEIHGLKSQDINRLPESLELKQKLSLKLSQSEMYKAKIDQEYCYKYPICDTLHEFNL